MSDQADRPGEREPVDPDQKDEEIEGEGGEVGPDAQADEGTHSDMGLASGGAAEADEGERVGADDED
jgi:hypothetical protein